MSAWRKGDHHIPSRIKHVENVFLRVIERRPFRWNEIQTPGIMALFSESVSDDPREFAGYQNLQRLRLQ
jgi:hypothetical protein